MQVNSTMTTTRARAEITNAFLRSVYNWMGVGLGLTALVSGLMVQLGLAESLMLSESGLMIFIGCAVVEIGLVFYLSARISKLSAGTASSLFLVYSALNGITLSVILMQYTQSSVVGAFISAAGMFAAASIYGLVTKRDLASLGGFMFMGLIGLIIASVVNMFMNSGPLGFVISLVGVVIFVGLTAYDTQYLKEMGNNVPENDATAVRRATILGALKLYLDFINLFIMLLRLMGDRR